MTRIRLGLIGDNIARSESPRLHVEAGRLCGLPVTYERLIPRDLGLDFDAVFDMCVAEGFRGINVTYPYKEAVVSRVSLTDPLVERISACNTVLFSEGMPVGHNTDYTGFKAAFLAAFGVALPGKVAVMGAGGVGKAIAFALATLGAEELRIYDPDRGKAARLTSALADSGTTMRIVAAKNADEASSDVDGLINCTPIGMTGYPGTAISRAQMRGATWAFDSVYTPVDTLFLALATQAGLKVLSGFELFFHQGVDAFRHFTGIDVDMALLKRAVQVQPREEVGS